MKRLHTTILASAAFSAALLMTLTAQAGDANLLGGKVSANVSMVSDYRYRGVSLSDKDFALQGGIDYAHQSGFYVGAWASSRDGSSAAYGELELDLYGGYTREVKGVTFDIGGMLYAYPTGNNFQKTDYVEAYGSVGTDLGFASVKAGAAYVFSNEATEGFDNIYGYGEIEVPVPGTPITLKGHFGYEDGAFDNNNKLDWLIGASVNYANLVFGVSYVDTNKAWSNYDSAAIFSVGAAF